MVRQLVDKQGFLSTQETDMTKRIGYGREANTPHQPKQQKPRQPWLRNRLGDKHVAFIREEDGTCFKAVIAGQSYAWVEIDPAEFEAANDK